MNPLLTELLKAIFAIAWFACVCGVARALFIRHVARSLEIAVGGFLFLLLMPLSYLYLSIALPNAAAKLLAPQAFAVWFYGPLLMAMLHAATKRPMKHWQVFVYGAPAIAALIWMLLLNARGIALPLWWTPLGLMQGALFAIVALVWTVRRRAQLRILVTAFSRSAYGALLYLSVGILALLLFDLNMHARMFMARPLTPTQYYLWVTPCAIYSLCISLWMLWQREVIPADVPVDATEPVQPEPLPELSRARKHELSESAAKELERLLEKTMSDQQLYTRNDLSLADLAKMLGLSTHLTSELLNVHMGTTFYAYVNRHRTAEAARLLRSGARSLSIADVAYEAGFNNVNTFYREFKNAHSMTPAQFRSSAQKVAAHPRTAIAPIGVEE
jgi:AraC-like DNA-binding protein